MPESVVSDLDLSQLLLSTLGPWGAKGHYLPGSMKAKYITLQGYWIGPVQCYGRQSQ